jgi:hypothetical protein
MTDADENQDGLMWPPNMLKTIQETSEQATRKQQEALQSLFTGAGTSGPDLGDITDQLGAMSQMATFKTRIQSGGRISIPDAEREALDIGEGDIVQTVVVPVKRNRGEDDE